MKLIIQKLLPIAGLIFLLWLFRHIDLREVLHLWSISSKVWLLAAVLVMPIQLAILTLKWSLLISKKISLWQLFRVRMIGAFFGTITPANAGTLVRAHYLRKVSNVSLAESASSVMLDKLLEIASLAILGFISMVGLSRYLVSNDQNITIFVTLVSFFMLLVLALIWLMTDKTLGRRLLREISVYILPSRLYELLKPYFLKLHAYLKPVDELWLPFLVNMLSYANSYLYVLFIIWAIGADLSYFTILITLPLSSLIALLPITISGIGTREASTVFLWSIFGVSAEQTVSVMLLAFIIGRVIPTVFGWFFLLRLNQQNENSHLQT